MPPALISNKPSKTRISAGVTSIGGVTILVFVAQQLPDSYTTLKPTLLYIAPTLTAVSNIFATEVLILCRDFYHQWKKDQAITKAEGSIKKCLDDPNTSFEHKNDMRKQLEQLQSANISNKVSTAKNALNDCFNPPAPPITPQSGKKPKSQKKIR